MSEIKTFSELVAAVAAGVPHGIYWSVDVAYNQHVGMDAEIEWSIYLAGYTHYKDMTPQKAFDKFLDAITEPTPVPVPEQVPNVDADKIVFPNGAECTVRAADGPDAARGADQGAGVKF